MSGSSKQNIIQRVEKNTGHIEANAAGGNITISPQTKPTQEISKEEAIQLLAQIESLMKTAFPEATQYIVKAKEEAKEAKPEQAIVLTQLDRAAVAIKKFDATAGATSDLVKKLEPLFNRLGEWLGLAASHFFG